MKAYAIKGILQINGKTIYSTQYSPLDKINGSLGIFKANSEKEAIKGFWNEFQRDEIMNFAYFKELENSYKVNLDCSANLTLELIALEPNQNELSLAAELSIR